MYLEQVDVDSASLPCIGLDRALYSYTFCGGRAAYFDLLARTDNQLDGFGVYSLNMRNFQERRRTPENTIWRNPNAYVCKRTSVIQWPEMSKTIIQVITRYCHRSQKYQTHPVVWSKTTYSKRKHLFTNLYLYMGLKALSFKKVMWKWHQSREGTLSSHASRSNVVLPASGTPGHPRMSKKIP